MKKQAKKLFRNISRTKLSVVFYVNYEIAIFFVHSFMRLGWLFQGKKRPREEDVSLMIENVTFIYKTFERQRMAKRLYKNIQKYYPGVKVIIADDSKMPLNFSDENLEIIQLPFNSGLSFGLNRALEKVETPFVVRMDDDELLTPNTRFHEQLKFILEHEEVDLVGILPFNLPHWTNLKKEAQKYYDQSMSQAPKKLKIAHMTQLDARRRVVAKPPNIFIVRTEKFREVGYDDNIRMIDHNEIFYRAAGNIVSVLDETAYVIHRHNQFDRHYQVYREDIQGDIEYIRNKMGKMKITTRFLETLGTSLKKETVTWEHVSNTQWKRLFLLAEQQQVLPLVFEAVCNCLAVREEQELLAFYRKKMFEQTAMQAVKTNEFLKIYKRICEQGIRPLVIKGLICRELYPLPNHRISTDEDVLILPEEFAQVHEILSAEGMDVKGTTEDIHKAYEVPYRREGSYIYIEVHKQLFPDDAVAYSEYNRFFDGAHERAIVENVMGTPIYTMCYTDHLLYLICHAFKHFLHSGIGVRQVCDIVLFANAHGKEIDWKHIFKCCQEMNSEKIVAAMFEIGEKYFGFDINKACYPEEFQRIQVEEETLLKDMLEGGILGNLGANRVHSSNITLNAVIADREGRQVKISVLKTVFPPVNKMKNRYQYLNKHPYLLPFAWICRVFTYGKDVKRSQDNSPIQSVAIGKSRVEMLKEYDVIKESK